MKTETPRTDNAQELFQDEYGSGHYVVESNFARHLERELNEYKDFARGILKNWDCDSGANGVHASYCRCCCAKNLLEKSMAALPNVES